MPGKTSNAPTFAEWALNRLPNKKGSGSQVIEETKKHPDYNEELGKYKDEKGWADAIRRALSKHEDKFVNTGEHDSRQIVYRLA